MCMCGVGEAVKVRLSAFVVVYMWRPSKSGCKGYNLNLKEFRNCTPPTGHPTFSHFPSPSTVHFQ